MYTVVTQDPFFEICCSHRSLFKLRREFNKVCVFLKAKQWLLIPLFPKVFFLNIDSGLYRYISVSELCEITIFSSCFFFFFLLLLLVVVVEISLYISIYGVSKVLCIDIQIYEHNYIYVCVFLCVLQTLRKCQNLDVNLSDGSSTSHLLF